MPLAKNEIHIFKSDLRMSDSEISECVKILSSDEIERADKFKSAIHRSRFIAARSTLRKLLANYLDKEPSEIVFSHSQNGKPYITGKEIEFNISHSNDLAVYAFSPFEVGIDVEFVRQLDDAIRIARRHFSDIEIKELESAAAEDMNEAFFNCWTGKEAFIKALGEGISYPLNEFAVTLNKTAEPAICWMKNEKEIGNWKLFRFTIEPGYISSVAVKNKDSFIVVL